MEFEEEESTGQNKLFVILSIALIGLLVLGLLGVGGVFIIRQNIQEQEAASRATPTLLAVLPNPTATPLPPTPKPTETVGPTPTNTPVVAAGSGGEEAAASSSVGEPQAESTFSFQRVSANTPVAGAAGAGTQQVVPETGLGGIEAVMIALGLTAVLFIARRLRMAS